MAIELGAKDLYIGDAAAPKAAERIPDEPVFDDPFAQQ